MGKVTGDLMGAQLCVQYMCMHIKSLTAFESGCHPNLETNMPDGITTVRISLKKEQHNLSGFLTLVQNHQPETNIKHSRTAILSQRTIHGRVMHSKVIVPGMKTGHKRRGARR